MAGMEEQRLVVRNEELIEREAARSDLRHERGQSVDVWSDLVDGGCHAGTPIKASVRAAQPGDAATSRSARTSGGNWLALGGLGCGGCFRLRPTTELPPEEEDGADASERLSNANAAINDQPLT